MKRSTTFDIPPTLETNMSSQAVQEAAFDASPFDLPQPKRDGVKADDLLLAFGGTLKLSRTNPADLELLEECKFGRDVELTIVFGVDTDGWTRRSSDEGDRLAYRVGLKAHTIRR